MTNSDQIRELTRLVTRLESAADYTEREQARLNAEGVRIATALTELDKRLAIVEEKLTELRRKADEKDRRTWAIVMACVGSILALLANIAPTYWKK